MKRMACLGAGLGLAMGVCGAAGAAEPAPGAAVPFVTREAEDAGNRTNGAVVKLAKLPGPTGASPKLEASGRGYVQLSKIGDYLEYPQVQAANAMRSACSSRAG